VFKKFFGKKNDGFFLQLEDEDAASKPAAKADSNVQDKAKDAKSSVAAVVSAVNPAAVITTATTAAPQSKAEQKAVKADKKDKKSAKQAEETKISKAPAPVAAPVAPAITNFATDYLIKPSSSSSRRLPGANMKGFLAMAQDIGKPKVFKATAEERKSNPVKPAVVVEKKAPINPKERQKLVTGEPEMRY
jgi:hypothetical protein